MKDEEKGASDVNMGRWSLYQKENRKFWNEDINEFK